MKKRDIAAVLLVALWIAGVYFAVRSARTPETHPKPPSHLRTVVRDTPRALEQPSHRVVPEGIHNFAALLDAHNAGLLPAGFDMAKAHFFFIAHDELVHVTFKKDGKIFWSRRPILIHAGEFAITDGVYTVLVRCGNQILETLPSTAPTQEIPTGDTIPFETPIGATEPNDGPLPTNPLLPIVSTPVPLPWTPLPEPPIGTPGIPIICCAGFPPSSPIPPSPPRHVTAASGDTFGVVAIAVLALILALAAYKSRRS